MTETYRTSPTGCRRAKVHCYAMHRGLPAPAKGWLTLFLCCQGYDGGAAPLALGVSCAADDADQFSVASSAAPAGPGPRAAAAARRAAPFRRRASGAAGTRSGTTACSDQCCLVIKYLRILGQTPAPPWTASAPTPLPSCGKSPSSMYRLSAPAHCIVHRTLAGWQPAGSWCAAARCRWRRSGSCGRSWMASPASWTSR